MASSTTGRVKIDVDDRRTRLTFPLTISLVFSLTLLLAGWSLPGCGSKAGIRHYRVLKPELVYAQNHVAAGASAASSGDQASVPTERLLGAIVPRGEQSWYFKMTGPMDLVAQQEQGFRQLIESLTFSGPDASPRWTLPASWQQEEGSGQRLATLTVQVEGQKLEVSIIQLPGGSSPTSILDNVNRWRRQMRLPPIDQPQLAAETTSVALSEGTAVLVNLVGNFSSGSMGTTSLSPSALPSAPPSAPPQQGLQYQAPAGWTQQDAVMFSVLTLGLSKAGQTAQISVSSLKGDGGGLLSNINRWFRQAGLPEMTDEELAGKTEQVDVGGIRGIYVEAIGDSAQGGGKAVVGWIGLQADRSWFVKMSGDAPLVRAEREAFRSFLNTVKF